MQTMSRASLGSIDPTIGGSPFFSAGMSDDQEEEHDAREPDVDDGPSLQSSNDHHGTGARYDRARRATVKVQMRILN
jgi:hypothetical protein